LSTRRNELLQFKKKQYNSLKKRLGLFKSDRENDVLSGALGNTEHTGCIRGVASQMSWKVGFPNDSWSYKKHDRLLLCSVLIYFLGTVFTCRMQSMDSDKLGDKSTIGILDLTHVNQASQTVTLNKNSEMYRNMSQQDFNKQVKE
jgi:hypothetical protein